MKLFTNKAPKREGSIKITLEYDALFVRNMAKNLRDAVYDVPNIIKFVMEAITEFEDMNKMQKREKKNE